MAGQDEEHASEDPRRIERKNAQPAKPSDERTDAERDRDRILFSSAFRRLAGVTQVAAPTELHPIHNRLTHSLKVAQIGRGLAVRLCNTVPAAQLNAAGGLDPTVVEAAGLAHDLGHPPFGHIAEHELNALITNGLSVSFREADDGPESRLSAVGLRDGFEGNAQSFRIVTKLAARFTDIEGLDLSRASLCALLKYPWLRKPADDQHSKKWGAYDSEADDLVWARELAPSGSEKMSLEAALMDWADDIAYAVHDLEDFFRAGFIPLERLAEEGPERQSFLAGELKRRKGDHEAAELDALSTAFRGPMEQVKFTSPYMGTRLERANLRQFTSFLINKYMDAVKFKPGEWGEDAISIDKDNKLEVETLKGLTWYYVIDSQSLASLRLGQRKLIRGLFEVYASAAFSGQDAEQRILPAFYREKLDGNPSSDVKLRLVADIIASMSEVQAVETYQRLTGVTLSSALVKPPA